jgi:imidazoleglycerol-phosphate dehydratase / histidinol-phosphatase
VSGTPVSGARLLLLDRVGALVRESGDEEAASPENVPSLENVQLMPEVIPALLELKRAGYIFVMVTGQDGLGTARLGRQAFDRRQRFVLELLASQGIVFDQIQVDLVASYLEANPPDRSRSFVVGGRDTDLELAASLGMTGLTVRLGGGPAETWPAIAKRILESGRRAQIRRQTKETEVSIDLDLSREAPARIATGLGFFDHMLEQVAKHGGFALELTCRGDLHIDEHHTIEDCGLALGTALREALGDKLGIARYGFLLPMDEAEAQVALDLSGRPYFVWEGRFNRERVGELPTELVPHFFRSLSETLGAALHIKVHGENTHHMIESCFKAVGRSLRQAIRREGGELPSTKGVL